MMLASQIIVMVGLILMLGAIGAFFLSQTPPK